MSQETSTIELTSRHQLVDLNKKLVNFKLDFQVVSHEDKEFDAVVLDSFPLHLKGSDSVLENQNLVEIFESVNYFAIYQTMFPWGFQSVQYCFYNFVY